MTTEQILALSGRELDRAVAEALGYVYFQNSSCQQYMYLAAGYANANFSGRWKKVDQPNPKYKQRGTTPCFSTDPAAAALVRAEVEAKGWEYRVFNLAHGTAKIRQHIAYLWGEGLKQQGAESGESEYIAFNRAFLLIHFAEKELNDE